jgi:hypothetical protein
MIHWTIEDSREKRWSSILAGATTAAIGCTRCLSCFTTEKIFASSGRANSWWRTYLSRILGEDFGYFRKKSPGITATRCVKCNNHTEEEATWEKEDQLKAEFPDIFSNLSESQGRDSSYGGRFVTPWIFKILKPRS